MERIIVGYDHGPAAQGALRWALDYARRTNAELVVVYAVSSSWEWELAAIQVNPDPIRHEIRQLLAESWTEAVGLPVCPIRRKSQSGVRPTRCSPRPDTTKPR